MVRTFIFISNICSLMSGEYIGEGAAVCGLLLAKYKMCKESGKISGHLLTAIMA